MQGKGFLYRLDVISRLKILYRQMPNEWFAPTLGDILEPLFKLNCCILIRPACKSPQANAHVRNLYCVKRPGRTGRLRESVGVVKRRDCADRVGSS